MKRARSRSRERSRSRFEERSRVLLQKPGSTSSPPLVSPARDRGEEIDERDFTEIETLVLSPLPAWEGLTFEEYRGRMQELARDISQEAKVRHRLQGTRPMGADRVRQVDPFSAPEGESRSPAPLFHTATREEFHRLRRAYGWFLESYREASERYRRGESGVKFPRGCFLPPRRFGHGWHPPPS